MLKTMINAALALLLLLASTAHGAWVMDGITFHDCQNPTAIREGYCVQGGEWRADLFVQPPQRVGGTPYNRVIKLLPSTFMANSWISVPRTKWKPDGTSKTVRTHYFTIDSIEIIERIPGEEIWDADIWLVRNQAGRESEIEVSRAIHGCTIWLRGLWTGIASNSPPLPNPLIDATFKYRNTDCED